jgi:site-specific recombinase XerD
MSTTLADHVAAFLGDMARVARLRPHTLRAYRYELSAAAAALTTPLDQLTLAALEQWVTRGTVSAATVARRTATLSRFFTWALRHQLCTTHPFAAHEATHTRRRLPRPIPAGDERTAIDTAITTVPPPYRHILILLRETGIRAGEALTLTIGDVTLAAGRESIRIRDPKNGTERIVVLGSTATPKALRMLRAHVGTCVASHRTRRCFARHGGHRYPMMPSITSGASSVRPRASLMPEANRAIPSINSAIRAAANWSSTATASRSSSASWATVTRALLRATRRCMMTKCGPP